MKQSNENGNEKVTLSTSPTLMHNLHESKARKWDQISWSLPLINYSHMHGLLLALPKQAGCCNIIKL